MKRFIAALIIFTFASLAFSQEKSEDSTSLEDAVKTFLGLDQPKIGFIGQVAGEIADNGNNTTSAFTIRNLRFYLSGTAGEHFAYVYQGDLNGSYSLLDLKLSYIFNKQYRIDGGRFKTPFGVEFLTNDARIHFVKRSTVATTIGTYRQYGIQGQGSLFEKRLTLTLGAFNGDTTLNNKKFLFIGKAHTIPIKKDALLPDLQFELGGSIAYTTDRYDLKSYPFYKNNHILFGVNTKVTYEKYWLEGEYYAATSNRNKTQDGFYFDIGSKINSEWEIIGRFDWSAKYLKWVFQDFMCQWILVKDINRKFLVGVNYYPLKDLKLQLDYERDQTLKMNSGWLNCQYAVNFE